MNPSHGLPKWVPHALALQILLVFLFPPFDFQERKVFFGDIWCILWVLTFIVGSYIYTKYRIYVRIPIEQAGHWKAQGFFDFKEHVASIGLVLLPVYWYLWKNAQNPEYDTARKAVTVYLAVACWFLFIVGHVLNNTRGFGS